MKLRILIAGDIHFPFASRAGLRRFYEIAKSLSPTHIIQIGDLVDFYSFSRFPRSLNLMTPRQELEQARSDALQFWLTLKAIAPKAKKYQLIGNHDARLDKKLISTFPEAEGLISAANIFDFPKVTTQRSERDEIIIENILFMHGFRSRLGDHAKHNSMRTVTGHSHRGGTVFLRHGDDTIWELNAGYLADESSPALSYTRQRLISNWTLGCGIIDELGPRFVPI